MESAGEYRKVEDFPGEFSIQNKDGVQTPLVRHKASHAYKTLEVCIAMDGNEDAEIRHLTTLSENPAIS